MRKKNWSRPLPPPEPGCRAAGYAWFVQHYQLDVLPHWRWTFVADRHTQKELERGGVTIHILRPGRWPGEQPLDQFLFALRYDGVSLAICRAIFAAVELEPLAEAIEAAVTRTPTGAYIRRAWFLLEALTGQTLAIDDIKHGNYIPLLDPATHFTRTDQKHRRQRINLNTLGPLSFAPVIRRTPALSSVAAAQLVEQLRSALQGYDDHTVRRAISYLYTRETMASFEIEHERPPKSRAERFISLLREAPRLAALDEATLTGLQNQIIDPRFADSGWRTEQNYVGESIDLARQRIHFVSPRPDDLSDLMAGFLSMLTMLSGDSTVDPVLSATAISFSFVLLHPFTDGNGRIHRWLIHWALCRGGLSDGEIIIPVSAVMLSHRREYDEALESFSRPLMESISYDLTDDGLLQVEGETADLYRHPDLTAMAEGLWRWLKIAIDRELPDQLRFLLGFDAARRGIQEIVDMPDRLITLFITVCRSNHGTLSRRKRERYFEMLTEDEITRMEDAVSQAFDRGE